MPVIVDGRVTDKNLPEIRGLQIPPKNPEELKKEFERVGVVELNVGERMEFGDKTVYHSGGQEQKPGILKRTQLKPGDIHELDDGVFAVFERGKGGNHKLRIISEKRLGQQNASETVRQKFGRFYTELIDAVGGDMPEDIREGRIEKIFEHLQGTSILPLANRMRDKVLKELERNRQLAEEHRGYDSPQEYLLASVLGEQGLANPQNTQIIAKAKDMVKFSLNAGVPILYVSDPDYMKELESVRWEENGKQFNLIPPEGQAVAFNGMEENDASFVFASQVILGGGVADDEFLKNKIRHEINHTVMHLMAKKDQTTIRESTPERAEAFRHFQSEALSYMFDAKHGFTGTPAESLVYTQDARIKKDAEYTRDIVGLCMQCQRATGGTKEDMMLDIYMSRSFEDMREKVIGHTVFPKKADTSLLNALYGKKGANYRTRADAVDCIGSKSGMGLDDDVVEEFFVSNLQEKTLHTPAHISQAQKNMGKFLKNAFGYEADTQRLTALALQKRTGLRLETATVLSQIPEDVTITIPSKDKEIEDATRVLFNYTNVTRDGVQETYKKLLERCPELRKEYYRQRDDIIADGERLIKKNFRTEEESQKPISMRTQKMREL